MAGEVRKFTRKEVATDKKASTIFIIDNQVYDVAKYLDEHPGGHKVLVDAAGKDATQGFKDIGHSLEAEELLKKFHIGEVVDEEKTENKMSHLNIQDPAPAAAATSAEPSFVSSWKFPVVLGILVMVLYTYLFG